VSVRTATAADVPRLAQLGQRMHAESPRFRRLRFNADRLGALLARAVDHPEMLLLVGELGGEVAGGFLGLVSQHWCSNDLVATDLALFVDSEKRGGVLAPRLLREYVRWAEARGAVLITAGVTTGVQTEMAERLYEAIGMTRCGALFEV
jgi:GNAT superfamily N-acetyltransferase